VEETGGNGPVRWGTAIALSIAALLLSVFDAIPLVVLPLSVLLVALPAQRRWKWVALGALLWLLAVALPGGALAELSRGWGLLLGGAYLAASLLRPQLGILHRALIALGVAGGISLAGLGATGSWDAVDALVRRHLQTVSSLTLASIGSQAADSAWVEQLEATAERVATLQWTLFPAVLGLQSLAALALASWWIARLRNGEQSPFRPRPLREFRFSDQLIWVLIAGLALLVLPLGAAATRVGFNALFFMGGLYALRGVGVFVFFASGAPPLFSILFGVLVAVFLYPLVLTAAVLVGLGDTWLDVRGRASLAPRP
jgi:hypothetical protein